MKIPYKPKDPKIKELTKQFINFEKQINDCI